MIRNYQAVWGKIVIEEESNGRLKRSGRKCAAFMDRSQRKWVKPEGKGSKLNSQAKNRCWRCSKNQLSSLWLPKCFWIAWEEDTLRSLIFHSWYSMSAITVTAIIPTLASWDNFISTHPNLMKNSCRGWNLENKNSNCQWLWDWRLRLWCKKPSIKIS